jgi:DHA3 family macrolide efflux protein-like MFS transporter
MTLDHFAGDTFKMSIVEIAWGVGMLAGGGLMSLPKFKFNNVMLINAMYVILGLTFAFSGILPEQGFYFFVAFTLIGGVAGAIFWGTFTVLLQTNLHSSVLGRVFSIHNSLIMIPAMFSLMATGYIADNIGITNAFIISGSMLIVIGLLSPLIPAIRKLAELKIE